MIGVALNAVGILVGATCALAGKRLSIVHENNGKVAMGAGTVIIGLQLTWSHLNGSWGSMFKQIGIVLLSMSLGRLCGKMLGLQRWSNRVGKFATAEIGREGSNQGFLVATMLACANPLAFYAATQEGLMGFSPAFVVKALMDGLAAFSFVAIFGRTILLSAITVLAFQGTAVLLVQRLAPFLVSHGVLDSILATDGLLICSCSLIILNLKKIELADYLPSLVIAPLLTWWWK